MSTFLCWVCVEQATVGLVEQFGKYVGPIGPGCHFVNCCLGKQLRGLISLRIQQLDVKCETKTKDNVFVTIVCSVQYAALREQVEDAFYKLTNPHQQIQAYVFDVVRASVPKLSLDDVFEQKDDIAHNVRSELEKVMGIFGYAIQQTLITDIEPDALVKRSMNEINANARLRLAANEKAEAEKILQVKRAEADAESKFLSGQGVARQRQAIVEGLRESVLAFSSQVHDTSAKDVLDIVLMTQYFDTLKDIGANSRNTTVFMPSNPGSIADLGAQIRAGFLQAEAAGIREQQQESTKTR